MRSGAAMMTTAAAANDNKRTRQPGADIYRAHEGRAVLEEAAVVLSGGPGPTITRATDNATEDEEEEDDEKKG